jgi:hypothetical protein
MNMDFLHTDFWGDAGDVVLVTLDGQANALLIDDSNFSAYRQGRSFSYCGGWATRSPVRLSPPHHGHWHVVVDLGGYSGSVRAGVRIVKREARAMC